MLGAGKLSPAAMQLITLASQATGSHTDYEPFWFSFCDSGSTVLFLGHPCLYFWLHYKNIWFILIFTDYPFIVRSFDWTDGINLDRDKIGLWAHSVVLQGPVFGGHWCGPRQESLETRRHHQQCRNVAIRGRSLFQHRPLVDSPRIRTRVCNPMLHSCSLYEWLCRGWMTMWCHCRWDLIESGGTYYQDMDRLVAMERALRAWANWADSKVDRTQTQLFFLAISPTHYK